MTVVLNKSVEDGMIDYFNSLSGYGISEERAQEKYLEMKREVENAARNSDFCEPPICLYAALGQTFNKDGDPIKTNLRSYIYRDKQSGSRWAFSFLVDTEQHKVIVYRMSHCSNVVNEEKRGTSIRRITRTELRQIVQEEVVKLLSKLIK